MSLRFLSLTRDPHSGVLVNRGGWLCLARFIDRRDCAHSLQQPSRDVSDGDCAPFHASRNAR